MNETRETIAVLGAGGIMGLPIARNLARAGYPVRAWNRTRDKAEPLAGDGVELFDDPADATAGAEIVLTMLSDADAVLESVDGALEQGHVWIQASTVGIEGSERCNAYAEEHGATIVDAPVLGTKAPAEQGKLTVLASGPDEARERCEPLFDAIGQKTLWLGEAGEGTGLKLVANTWTLALTEAIGETFALAEGLGVDPAGFLEAVSGGPLDVPYLQLKGKAIMDRDFEPSFKLSLAAKDARLIAEAAEQHGLDLPLAETLRDRMAEGAVEHGDEDMAATFLTSAG